MHGLHWDYSYSPVTTRGRVQLSCCNIPVMLLTELIPKASTKNPTPIVQFLASVFIDSCNGSRSQKA